MTHQSDTQHGSGRGGAFGFVRKGYDRADIRELTTADVDGATVYGRHDETIGSIRSLKVGTDGNITDAIIDVGGFLGIGAHRVLVPFSQLTVLREAAGSDVRVHLDATKDKLEAMSEYVG